MKNNNYNVKSKEELILLLTHKDRQINQQSKQIIFLEKYVRAHKLRQFGNKSEKSSALQINLFDEATLPKDADKILQEDAASGLLSHVLVSKFQDYLPLYRQEKILKRLGIDIPRATLCLWVLKCAALLKPLMKLLQDDIITYDIAYADETTIQVLKEPSKDVQSKKYMRLFAGGPPDKFCFYYQYHPSRKHEVCLDFFEDFKGYLHCDGFPGYDLLASKNKSLYYQDASIM